MVLLAVTALAAVGTVVRPFRGSSSNGRRINKAMREAGISVRQLEQPFRLTRRADPLTLANQYRKGGLPHVHIVDAREYDA